MQAYAIYWTATDGCTYSCDILHMIFAKRCDAETEITRLELLALEGKELLDHNEGYAEFYVWKSKLSFDDGVAAEMARDEFEPWIEAVEIR